MCKDESWSRGDQSALGPYIQKAGGKVGKDRLFGWVLAYRETLLSFAQGLC